MYCLGVTGPEFLNQVPTLSPPHPKATDIGLGVCVWIVDFGATYGCGHMSINIGVLIITYTILGVPNYGYGPQDPVLIIKAPILSHRGSSDPETGQTISRNAARTLRHKG